MASALKSAFGSSGSSAANPLTTFGEPRVYRQGATHAHGHGFLKNLLEDAVATAKGIPFGIVQTVEHPIRTVQQFGHSYSNYYGHGFGHFMHEFSAHPLQPLLDAISVPLVLAGGAGFALKGASAAAELGHAGEIGNVLAHASKLTSAGRFAEADALRTAAEHLGPGAKMGDIIEHSHALAQAHNYGEADLLRTSLAKSPKLMKLAQNFQKGTSATTRMLEGPSGLQVPARAYSSNLFRRVLTQGSDKVIENTLGRLGPKNEAGLHTGYFSATGLGERAEAKMIGRHMAATTGRKFRQARFLHEAEQGGFAAADAGQKLRTNFERVLLENAPKVTAEDAQKIMDNPVGKSRWNLVAHEGEQEGFRWERDANGGLVAHKTKIPSALPGRTVGKDLGGYEPEQLKNFIETELPASLKMTKTLKNGWQDSNGLYTLVRDGAPTAAAKEMEGARNLMSQIYKSPLKVWKLMILGAAPRYFVNNVIGNAGMYAASTNPVEFSRGVVEAVKSARGIRAAAKVKKGMHTSLDQLAAKLLPNEFVDETMGYLQHGAMALEGVAGMGTRNPLSRAATSGLFPITEKVAYRATQRASIMGALTTLPDFRNLYRHYKTQGMEQGAAFQKAARTITRDPRKAAALEKRVTDWAGQYYHLNSGEKLMTAIVPFYNWDRHALRFGKEQVLSRPVSTVVMSQLGAIGDKQATKELGHVPDFLKGAIPVGSHSGGILGFLLGQQGIGRKKVILTAGYNPLAAASEDARAIAALAGGGHAREAIGGQLNPVLSGAIAGVTGQKLFSGAKANYSGPLQGALSETFAQLPQVRTAESILAEHGIGKKVSGKNKKGEPTLYTKDMRQQVSSILGLNERDFSPKAAQKLYATEQGIKKGRRRVRYSARQAAQTLGGKSSLKSGLKSQF